MERRISLQLCLLIGTNVLVPVQLALVSMTPSPERAGHCPPGWRAVDVVVVVFPS